MYTILRIVILLFIISIILIVNRKNTNISGRRKISKFVALSLVFFWILLLIPFENYILNFNTPEEVFKYGFFYKDIINIVEDNDTAYITYLNSDSSFSYESVVKKNGSWKLPNNLNINKVKFIIYKDYSITILKSENGEKAFVKVSNMHLYDSSNQISVSDNRNSIFKTFSSRLKIYNQDILHYYTIVNLPLDNYELTINNEIVYIN